MHLVTAVRDIGTPCRRRRLLSLIIREWLSVRVINGFSHGGVNHRHIISNGRLSILLDVRDLRRVRVHLLHALDLLKQFLVNRLH